MFSDTHADVLLYPHRLKNFAGFSMRLAGLFAQYNIPGEKYTNLKRFFIYIYLAFIFWPVVFYIHFLDGLFFSPQWNQIKAVYISAFSWERLAANFSFAKVGKIWLFFSTN